MVERNVALLTDISDLATKDRKHPTLASRIGLKFFAPRTALRKPVTRPELRRAELHR